jgi:hypothetical protein
VENFKMNKCFHPRIFRVGHKNEPGFSYAEQDDSWLKEFSKLTDDLIVHEYLSKEESDYLIAQARAEVYREAADTFRMCGETAVELAYLDKAKAEEHKREARGGKDAESN